MTRATWWVNACLATGASATIIGVLGAAVVEAPLEYARTPAIPATVVAVTKVPRYSASVVFVAPDGQNCHSQMPVHQLPTVGDRIAVRARPPYCYRAYRADDEMAPLLTVAAASADMLLVGTILIWNLVRSWRRRRVIDAMTTEAAIGSGAPDHAAPGQEGQPTADALTWPAFYAPDGWILKMVPLIMINSTIMLALAGAGFEIFTILFWFPAWFPLLWIIALVRLNWVVELNGSILSWHGPFCHGQTTVDRLREIRPRFGPHRRPLTADIVLVDRSRISIPISADLIDFAGRLRQVAPQLVVDRWIAVGRPTPRAG